MTNPFIDTVIQSLLDGGTMEMEGETYRLIRTDQPVYRIVASETDTDSWSDWSILRHMIERGVLVRIGGET